MKVLEEVRALSSGRVPQVCKDRKTEHQRRQSRLRSATKVPYRTLEDQLLATDGYRKFYSKLGSLRSVLQAWPFGELVEPPARRRQPKVVERLNFQDQGEAMRAARLRAEELPFILHNVPEIDRAVRAWSTPGELAKLLGDSKLAVTVAGRRPSFMYFDLKASTPSWVAENNYSTPTGQVLLSTSVAFPLKTSQHFCTSFKSGGRIRAGYVAKSSLVCFYRRL